MPRSRKLALTLQPPAKLAIVIPSPVVETPREQWVKPSPSLYAPDISAAEWTALAERSANVFATAEWLSVWWRHFGGGREQLTASWRRPDGSLIAIAPLYRSSRGPFVLLRLTRAPSAASPRGDAAPDALGGAGDEGERGRAVRGPWESEPQLSAAARLRTLEL